MAVPVRKTKGELTTERILDAAEIVFAAKGFDGASLRDIATQAGIREPGLYNYFKNKQDLYEAVLDRALLPMSRAMSAHLSGAQGLQAYTELPAVMTDLLLEHPRMSALFQQALQGERDSVGNQLVLEWLDRLFEQGMETMRAVGVEDVDEADLAIQTIALFNLCTGYFLAQPVFEKLVGGNLSDEENIVRQKKLLSRVQRALLLG